MTPEKARLVLTSVENRDSLRRKKRVSAALSNTARRPLLSSRRKSASCCSSGQISVRFPESPAVAQGATIHAALDLSRSSRQIVTPSDVVCSGTPRAVTFLSSLQRAELLNTASALPPFIGTLHGIINQAHKLTKSFIYISLHRPGYNSLR